GGEVAVAPDPGHLLELETEDLCGDRAQRRGRAAADVRRGAADDRGAVELHADPGTCRIARPAHAAVGRERDGDGSPDARRSTGWPALAESGPRPAHRLRQHRVRLQNLARGERV